MECFCGCGTKVSRKLADAGFTAAQVGLELLAWDKARTTSPLSVPVEAESLIARGADCYQRLIAAIHGDDGPDPVPASEAWLEDSFEARRDRRDMTTTGSLLSRPRLTLTELDYAELNRLRPELSFSANSPTPEAGETERADEDPVAQLKGLGKLHAAGALTDEEFAEAKARVIARLG